VPRCGCGCCLSDRWQLGWQRRSLLPQGSEILAQSYSSRPAPPLPLLPPGPTSLRCVPPGKGKCGQNWRPTGSAALQITAGPDLMPPSHLLVPGSGKEEASHGATGRSPGFPSSSLCTMTREGLGWPCFSSGYSGPCEAGLAALSSNLSLPGSVQTGEEARGRHTATQSACSTPFQVVSLPLCFCDGVSLCFWQKTHSVDGESLSWDRDRPQVTLGPVMEDG